MTYPMQANKPQPQSANLATLGSSSEFCFPQSGARPVTFNGMELAMAMSFTPSLPYWYELNVYRTDEQGFAVAIRKFYQSETETDRVKGWTFASIEEALSHLENYDAASDVFVPELKLSEMAPAEMAAHAMALKAEVDAARAHFAGLVGELFFEIENSGAAAA